MAEIRPRIPDPKRYNGDSKSLNTWLYALKVYFRAIGSVGSMMVRIVIDVPRTLPPCWKVLRYSGIIDICLLAMYLNIFHN